MFKIEQSKFRVRHSIFWLFRGAVQSKQCGYRLSLNIQGLPKLIKLLTSQHQYIYIDHIYIYMCVPKAITTRRPSLLKTNTKEKEEKV